MNEGILGLITGIVFGALLQQGRALRFEKQIGALLLKDMTILKFMFSAIIVGMLGINVLVHFGVMGLSVKATQVGANLIGGALFGAGWAFVGYCPGTSMGAFGEGRWHAIWGILGMLVGAAIYAEVVPFLETNILSWGVFGKITLPQVFGVSLWLVLPGLVVLYLVLLAWFEKKKV